MQLRRVQGGEKPDEQDEGDELFRVISQRGHGHPHVCMCGRHLCNIAQRLQPPARARWADITLHQAVFQPAVPNTTPNNRKALSVVPRLVLHPEPCRIVGPYLAD